ncbi:AI-2 transport protein TqsA [Clostridium acetireducens DSM 10703]|jgi:predicted PurR-regulated permease PerM|uniref:AI-2 transport protein TqsA n=2 Tax=Clostridium TaxID=1485 RepID=A0A1E8EX93_9CLOT|nr:AI-2 transport protein TqsA [Clostridium acetireducens DSM 10703]
MNMKNYKLKKIIKIVVYFLIILLMFFFIRKSVLKDILNIVLLAFIVSYLLKPIYIKLINRNIKKNIAALVTILFFVTFIVLLFVYLIPIIIKESNNIGMCINDMENYINEIYEKIKPLKNNKVIYLSLNNIYVKINNQIIKFFSTIFNSIFDLAQNIVNIIIVPIAAYYFLVDRDIIYSNFLNLFPVKIKSKVNHTFKHIDKILGKYIISQIILCIIIGILTFVILYYLGVNYPILLSILNAFFNIIPYFGPIFGAIPCIIIALLKSVKVAVITAICIYIMQQIEGNIIAPKITADSVNMHPLIVIFLVIVGGKLGGFLGMVLAIPFGAVIKVIYEDVNYYMFK